MTRGASSRIPLPRHWSAQVKSAVVFVVSLAHKSLVFTRSVAANSSIQRVRLQAELDEARTELALLREEMRIKDARAARVPQRSHQSG